MAYHVADRTVVAIRRMSAPDPVNQDQKYGRRGGEPGRRARVSGCRTDKRAGPEQGPAAGGEPGTRRARSQTCRQHSAPGPATRGPDPSRIARHHPRLCAARRHPLLRRPSPGHPPRHRLRRSYQRRRLWRDGGRARRRHRACATGRKSQASSRPCRWIIPGSRARAASGPAWAIDTLPLAVPGASPGRSQANLWLARATVACCQSRVRKVDRPAPLRA